VRRLFFDLMPSELAVGCSDARINGVALSPRAERPARPQGPAVTSDVVVSRDAVYEVLQSVVAYSGRQGRAHERRRAVVPGLL
jgi:hypothetical protein